MIEMIQHVLLIAMLDVRIAAGESGKSPWLGADSETQLLMVEPARARVYLAFTSSCRKRKVKMPFHQAVPEKARHEAKILNG